jgi:integrase
MFQIAINEWGIPLKENPLDKVTLKAKDNRRERRLKDGEYEKLLAAARTRQNPFIEKIVVFAIETGMRRGEILNLCWDQVDLKRRSVTILESKNGYSRTIPITQLAALHFTIAVEGRCQGVSNHGKLSPSGMGQDAQGDRDRGSAFP